MTRRSFFAGAAAMGVAAVMRGDAQEKPVTSSKLGEAAGRPLFVSTWKQGKPANEKAAEVLSAGGSLLDAIEKGINTAELDPEVLSVGYGAKPNEDGVLQLDAAIMDGATHRAGAVAALEMIPTPISVARRVLERTRHTLLAGDGALRFAIAEGFEPQQLNTPKSLHLWERWRKDPYRKSYRRLSGKDARRMPRPIGEEAADTITMVALDAAGNLAAGGSTSGLEWKISGRVGDVPLLGAGIFVDNGVGAAGATGDGDEMQKFSTSAIIVERMRAGMSPQAACESVLGWMLETNPENKDIEACVYAVNKRGEFGACSIRPKDFTYAVWMPGVSELRVAKSLL
ncbi:MAG: N(4)-(beta-N-acetylglucosaminyl)-L-asparaginase [Candidatus Acidiferrales bacterium]